MKTVDSDIRNQNRCKDCGRVVGCDDTGRTRKCGCKEK